jgi:hypothetical protein
MGGHAYSIIKLVDPSQTSLHPKHGDKNVDGAKAMFFEIDLILGDR